MLKKNKNLRTQNFKSHARGQILLFIFIVLDIRVNFDLILRKGDCQIVTNGMKLESAVDDSPWNALVYD